MSSGILLLLLLLAVAGAGWLRVGRYQPGPYWRAPDAAKRLSGGEVCFVAAAAEALFPAGGAMPVSGEQADLPGYMDGYLDVLPRAQRTQLKLLFFLFEHATVVYPAPSGARPRRRFSDLSETQRAGVLKGWSSSPFFPRRFAFMALRAALTMGYLGHPENLRFLGLAPAQVRTPIVKADLLFPRIGASRASIPYRESDLGSEAS